MSSVIVFSDKNDVIYCDFKAEELRRLYSTVIFKQEPFVDNAKLEYEIDVDIIVQIFSPLVTSYQVLSAQLNNPYQVINCQNGTKVVFHKYLSYIFIGIGSETIEALQVFLQFYVHYTNLVCGPLINKLKNSLETKFLLTNIVKTALYLFDNNPTVMMQAIRNQSMSPVMNKLMYKTLTNSLESMKARTDLNAAHGLLISGGKLLSIFSRRGTKELTMYSVIDIFVISQVPWYVRKCNGEDNDKNSDPNVYSAFIFLYLGCHLTPYIVFSRLLVDDIYMVILCQAERTPICDNLNQILLSCNLLSEKPSGRNVIIADGIEQSCKKLFENLKKAGVCQDIYQKYKGLINTKWENLKKNGLWEFLSGHETYMPSKVQSSLQSFQDITTELFRILCFNDSSVSKGTNCAKLIFSEAANSLQHLHLKMFKRLSSMHHYLEDFPGLVHFMLIDQTENILVSPDVELNGKNAIPSLWKKLKKMVDKVRKNLNASHFSVLWKDKTFFYSYFLWVEDLDGHVLKIRKLTNDIIKQCQAPKVLLRDFYKLACREWFPEKSFDSLKVKELYCIHLNLATPPCIIEHCRRLAATLCEEISSEATLHIL